MKPRLLLFFLFFWVDANSQVPVPVPNPTPIVDSVLYDIVNYIPVGPALRQPNSFYDVMYKNKLDTSYKMKQSFLDSGLTKKISKIFYHNANLNGPYEAYDMDKVQAKGNYKEGRLDGQRLTYYYSGIVQEKAQFTNGKRSGIWEYKNLLGVLLRRITYDDFGHILQDQQFRETVAVK